MSKIITSPVKHWPGTAVLSDPLNYPQLFMFQDALILSRGLGEDASYQHHLHVLLPGVLACVESFSLAGLPEQMTAETFPATPVTSAVRLANWLIAAVTDLFSEADESPNGSGPPSIAT